MKTRISSPDTQNRVILYTAADGKVTADVFFVKETFWLAQRTMAELFGINTPAISKHLKNIYASGELAGRGNCFHFGNSSNGRATPSHIRDRNLLETLDME